MLQYHNVEIRNFLSVGTVPQTVDLTRSGFTLVLGENLDMGGQGNRNGVGKTTLLNAISYALYGQALSNIKKDNLVNRIKSKNMSVCLEFSRDGQTYRIERGRKPAFFRFIVNDQMVNSPDTDEAQGENRETQKQVEAVLGMTHTMFCNIVALNTYTLPFLSQGAGKQREIIEELLMITMLSTKAETLKERIKETRIQQDQEDIKIKTIEASNEKIARTLADLNTRSEKWQVQHQDKINDIQQALDSMSQLDIEVEIQAHRDRLDVDKLKSARNEQQRLLTGKNRLVTNLQTQLDKNMANYRQVLDAQCPMCQQGLSDHNHKEILANLEQQILQLDQQLQPLNLEVKQHQEYIQELAQAESSFDISNTLYNNLEQALSHLNSMENLQQEMSRLQQETNPYLDQQHSLTATLQPINHNILNQLNSQREHQEFLLKLLTNKESFIRKKIIDQNLAYLNTRLQDYLNRVGLPHQVKFQNDLGVEITHLGTEMDFDQLSRGERTRLILSLSWSFRDIWENNNQPINLIFVDELLDQGLDPQGLEKSVEILKAHSRDRNKNVFLVSHREELVSRVSNVLTVVKEDNFSRFEWGYEG
jgi:DNA repair exonuclease SbcCD ATPase subunit